MQAPSLVPSMTLSCYFPTIEESLDLVPGGRNVEDGEQPGRGWADG